jgi:hypothetical protein
MLVTAKWGTDFFEGVCAPNNATAYFCAPPTDAKRLKTEDSIVIFQHSDPGQPLRTPSTRSSANFALTALMHKEAGGLQAAPDGVRLVSTSYGLRLMLALVQLLCSC